MCSLFQENGIHANKNNYYITKNKKYTWKDVFKMNFAGWKN